MKVKQVLFAILLLIAVVSVAQSDTDKEMVQRALMDYIEAFYEGDSSKIIRSISPGVVKYGYWKEKRGSAYEGMSMSFREMIAYVNNVAKQPRKKTVGANEKVEVYEVKDKTASGKVTAWWGSDYILLEKINDKWMIRMILWQSPEK